MRILFLIVALFCISGCGQLKEMNANMQESTENLKKNTATVQHSSEVISKNTEEVASSTLNMRIFGIIGLIALVAILWIALVFYKRHRRLLHDIKVLVDRIKRE